MHLLIVFLDPAIQAMIAETMFLPEVLLHHGTFTPQLSKGVRLLLAFPHDTSFNSRQTNLNQKRIQGKMG
jgi:hypothetical protein